MAALNTFIAQHIPLELRHARDFTGPRGWCYILNRLLRKLEREGLFDLSLRKETGVEVEDDYWIDLPSDCRRILEIYYPPFVHYSEREIRYRHEIVQTKIKIRVPFDKDEDPDIFTLSAGSATSIKINDADATADQWKDYLLVLTNGTYSGDTILISSNTAADGGTSTLAFRHAFQGTVDSTAGYLTKTYLMLLYSSKYTDVSAEDDEIPLDDRYEDILAPWLCKEALPPGDKRKLQYQAEFDEVLNDLYAEHFTPTPDQARPRPRSMPGLENCEDFESSDSEYIGEDE